MKVRDIKGNIILLIAAVIWGFAFVAQNDASDLVEPFTFNCLRSLIAAVVLGALVPFINKAEIRSGKITDKKLTVKAGVVCGALLFVAVNFQQFGIMLYPDNAAASGRSGFITALYVILVPVFSLFLKKKAGINVFVSVIIAIIGMYLLCFAGGIDKLYLSDGIVFCCAVAFAVHVIVIDIFSDRVNGIKLSCVQFLTCGILSSLLMFFTETPKIENIFAAVIPILYLGIMSSAVAYTLEIIGVQYSSNPSVAAIIMSLESVFAFLGGWWLSGEKSSAREIIGCLIMFFAIILVQLPTNKLFRKKQ